MPNSTWGLCKECRWWQIEPNAAGENQTMGECIEEKLQPFSIRISGNGGCSCFQQGTPARGRFQRQAAYCETQEIT